MYDTDFHAHVMLAIAIKQLYFTQVTERENRSTFHFALCRANTAVQFRVHGAN